MNKKITLDEFCKKLSLSDKRVELIGGFFHYMKHQKKMERATAAQFNNEYAAFCKLPA